MNSAKSQVIKSTYRNLLPFLHTNSKAAKKELKESIPFTTAPKTVRFIGINLTKEVKDLCFESYRRLMKDIEDNKKWKTFHAHGLEKQTLLKYLYYPKQSTYLMQSLSKY